jgi:hypothetical protein
VLWSFSEEATRQQPGGRRIKKWSNHQHGDHDEFCRNSEVDGLRSLVLISF